MNRRTFLTTAASALAAPPTRPNVVLIYADDVGYGDLSCYGAAKVRTPNLDRLASQGLRFTDAHSPSATCTPSRYAMMTGEYAWRKPGTAILQGDAAMIIEPGRVTLPSVFKQAGYRTGVVGKWHLGLGNGNLDWNTEIKPGPREIGFDYSFLIPATGDRVPCVYVENQRVAGLDPRDPITVSYTQKVGGEPTGKENPELLKMKLSQGHDQTIVNGISRIGFMSGGRAARWVDQDMASVITHKAVLFMEQNRAHPFFLYFATHDIHVPRAPRRQFAGKSSCGARCDAIQQLDASVGEIMKALDRTGLARNTILIFSSDNGPVVNDGYDDGADRHLNGHTPAGVLRGGKYSLYEGGTRLPFLARWPERIKPGVSDALLCQIDFVATFAALTGQTLPHEAGPDSFNMLAALVGESRQGRDHLVEHTRAIALRRGNWKLIPAESNRTKKGSGEAELYDLGQDIGETRNLAAAQPERVRQMTAELERIQAAGRSR